VVHAMVLSRTGRRRRGKITALSAGKDAALEAAAEDGHGTLCFRLRADPPLQGQTKVDMAQLRQRPGRCCQRWMCHRCGCDRRGWQGG